MVKFDILKEGQKVKVFSEVHRLYPKPIQGVICAVITPTHYMVKSEEVQIDGYASVLTFNLLTETMDYELTEELG